MLQFKTSEVVSGEKLNISYINLKI